MTDPSAMYGPFLPRRSVLVLAYILCTGAAMAAAGAQVPPDGESVADAVAWLQLQGAGGSIRN